MRGTGKSTKAKELLSLRSRVIVYDTLCEYSEGIVCENLLTLLQVLKKVSKEKKFFIVYQPVNPNEDFGEVCEIVYDLGNCSFVVEEIDSFLSINPAGLDYSFLNIVQRGRHKLIELIGITQRPYSLPTILRSQCKEMHTFKQFEDRDVQWLRGIYGDRAEEVKTLPQFNYLEFNNGDINKRITKKV